MARTASLPVVPPSSSRFPFDGFPRGWFVVAFSTDVVAGAPPLALRYFGRDLVAFRTTSGEVAVTGAYCPHLGAHLAHGGVVEGEHVRCPFHGWKFGADGRCAGIPYGEHVPPRAKLETMPVREVNGVVHVFFDPDGGAPWPLPVLDETGWTAGKTVHWKNLRTHPQEVFENTVDVAHIGPVHDGQKARLGGPPKRDGERMVVEVQFDAPGDIVGMPGTLNDVHLLVTMTGLGVVHVETHVRNAGVRARQRIYATPVEDGTIDIRGIVHVLETDDAAFTAEVAEIFYKAYVSDFARDFPIWENKRYLTRPAIARADGPIGVYRHWCEQFYRHAPAASPEAAESVSESRASAWLATVVTRASAARELLSQKLARRAPAERPRPSTPDTAEAKPAVVASPAANPAPAAPKRRVASAAEYKETLEARFVPQAAREIDAVFQWELGGPRGDVFHARVQRGHIEVCPGPHEKPTVALVMDADDYVSVVNGDLDGTWAFTTGRGKVRGDLAAAMKMRAIFPA